MVTAKKSPASPLAGIAPGTPASKSTADDTPPVKSTAPAATVKVERAPAKRAPKPVARKGVTIKAMAPKAVTPNAVAIEAVAVKASAAKAVPDPAKVKVKKPKLVRDSFTIPKAEYIVIEELKQRAAGLNHPAKKSELLRAGITALAAMSGAAFLAALRAVPTVETGRRSKA